MFSQYFPKYCSTKIIVPATNFQSHFSKFFLLLLLFVFFYRDEQQIHPTSTHSTIINYLLIIWFINNSPDDNSSHLEKIPVKTKYPCHFFPNMVQSHPSHNPSLVTLTPQLKWCHQHKPTIICHRAIRTSHSPLKASGIHWFRRKWTNHTCGLVSPTPILYGRFEHSVTKYFSPINLWRQSRFWS